MSQIVFPLIGFRSILFLLVLIVMSASFGLSCEEGDAGLVAQDSSTAYMFYLNANDGIRLVAFDTTGNILAFFASHPGEKVVSLKPDALNKAPTTIEISFGEGKEEGRYQGSVIFKAASIGSSISIFDEKVSDRLALQPSHFPLGMKEMVGGRGFFVIAEVLDRGAIPADPSDVAAMNKDWWTENAGSFRMTRESVEDESSTVH